MCILNLQMFFPDSVCPRVTTTDAKLIIQTKIDPLLLIQSHKIRLKSTDHHSMQGVVLLKCQQQRRRQISLFVQHKIYTKVKIQD